MRKVRSEDEFNDLMREVRASAALLAWSEKGYLQALVKGPATLEELGGDQRALEITSIILVGLGILETDQNRVMLTPEAHEMVRTRVFDGASASRFFGEMSRLPQVMAEGGPVRGNDGEDRDSEIGVRVEEPDAVRGFMDMLDRRSVDSANYTARVLHSRIPASSAVLDLGGGHGRYARELAELGHQATLFDLPTCVSLARERHGDCLAYHEGDFFEDDLGGPYEAILLSNIVHGLGVDQITALFERASRSLTDTGRVVVKDMFVDPLGGGPSNAVAFGLVMLMYTQEGRSYTLSALKEAASRAGLVKTDFEFSASGQFALVFFGKG